MAVVPVLLFHAQVPGFGGGFVGVDIFFVISGFLITRLLARQLEGGRFSLAAFYERRVRRIFPALIAMLLVVSLVASWLLLPQHLAPYGRSVMATSLFASNLFFARSGYFVPETDALPLLHTWSLGVEEQFYIVYPLLLWIAWRRGPKVALPVIALFTAASFVLAESLLVAGKESAFFLPQTRAWQLGLGCILAMTTIAPGCRPWVRDAAGVAGLAMIGCAVTLYSSATPFPGVAALLPCLGAALVIWAGCDGRRHLGGAMLTWRPVVFVGLVSYSLYLWHWPLLAFASYPSVDGPSPLARALALAASFGLAVASWRWVERPFRGRRGLMTRRQLATAAAGAMSAILSFGWIAHGASGWPARLDPDVRRIAAAKFQRVPITHPCFKMGAREIRAGRLCRTGEPTAPASFVVWGDSHARALAGAVGSAARLHGRAGVVLAQAGCPPLLGLSRADGRAPPDCDKSAAALLDHLRDRPEIRDVVLISRWALVAEGSRYGLERAGHVKPLDLETAPSARADNLRVFERALSRTVARLQAEGKRVWIVGPVPEIGVDVPRALANAARFGVEADIAPSRAEFEARQDTSRFILSRVAARHGAIMVPVHEALCDASHCRVQSREGRPLYYDDDHLSFTGGRAIVPALQAIFDEERVAQETGSSSRLAAPDALQVARGSPPDAAISRSR